MLSVHNKIWGGTLNTKQSSTHGHIIINLGNEDDVGN